MSYIGPPDLDPEAFDELWGNILRRLTAKEQEVLETVLSGAEVQHSLLYMLIAFALGLACGALGMRLWL